MTAFVQFPGFRRAPAARAVRRSRALARPGAVLAGGACLLLAACSGSPSTSSLSAGSGAGSFGRAAPDAAGAGTGAGSRARLAVLPHTSGPLIVYTASLTVRAKNVSAAAGLAAKLATSAGGYVSAEQATAGRPKPDRGAVRIVLKVPSAGFAATLAGLSRLGTRLSQSQQSQDVTQTVADVSSRVASAQDAIAQLRKLLTRAGTVHGLLSVQNQIDGEEASLEALQAQQRALARETTYATISVDLVSPPAVVKHHRQRHAGGFAGGLSAGWRGLRAVTSALLTAVGAALPFAVPLALLAGLGYALRRRLRRSVPGPTPGAPGP